MKTQRFDLHVREFRLKSDNTSARIIFNEGGHSQGPLVGVYIPCILNPKGELVEMRLIDYLKEGEDWREVLVRLVRGAALAMTYTHGLEHVDYRRVEQVLGKLTNDEIIERKTEHWREIAQEE